jgi:AbrB family looped-hinge helix DNA binding protein
MTVLTIDNLGRVMLPEGIRQALGLNPEDQLTLEIQDGKIVLQPVSHTPRVYYEGRVLVVQSELTGSKEGRRRCATRADGRSSLGEKEACTSPKPFSVVNDGACILKGKGRSWFNHKSIKA